MMLRLPKSLLFLFISAIVLVILIFIYVIINIFSTVTEVPQENISPTPIPVEKPQATSTIRETSVSPPEDISGKSIKNPSQQIAFDFTDTVTPDTVTVNVTPVVPLVIEQGAKPNQLIIFPKPPDFWYPNVSYLLTVRDEASEVITSYVINVPLYEVPYEPL